MRSALKPIACRSGLVSLRFGSLSRTSVVRYGRQVLSTDQALGVGRVLRNVPPTACRFYTAAIVR